MYLIIVWQPASVYPTLEVIKVDSQLTNHRSVSFQLRGATYSVYVVHTAHVACQVAAVHIQWLYLSTNLNTRSNTHILAYMYSIAHRSFVMTFWIFVHISSWCLSVQTFHAYIHMCAGLKIWYTQSDHHSDRHSDTHTHTHTCILAELTHCQLSTQEGVWWLWSTVNGCVCLLRLLR